MRVYFIRHAIAVPHEAPGVVDDASRELTREGITRMREQARGLARLKIAPRHIWTSPYKRAKQTAEIVAKGLGLTHAVKVLPALAPGGDFEQVMDYLTTHDAKPQAATTTSDEIALVGHEPDLSEMITRLLTGMDNSIVQLKKGGAACVELEDMHTPYRGQLIWLLTPRLLRALA
jgi:phosphohistidine phosphatase